MSTEAGLWLDGSKGPKTLPMCPGCLWPEIGDRSETRCPDCDLPIRWVPILPTSISLELARAMELTEQRIVAATGCPEQEDFRLEVTQASLELRNALLRYAEQVSK